MTEVDDKTRARISHALDEAQRLGKEDGLKLRDAVDLTFTKLISQIQNEQGELVRRAGESVERVVANTYADAIATCMELRPPARDAAEAIEKRQRETTGGKEPEKGATPMAADLWAIGGGGE